MLTKEENETLVRVGPGTPGGRAAPPLLAPGSDCTELTDENPTIIGAHSR